MVITRLRSEPHLSAPSLWKFRRLTYQSDKSNALKLSATGTGDLTEFTSKLESQRASFGYIRVKYANDDHSFREKFALVIWIGEEVKIMRRAKVSICSPHKQRQSILVEVEVDWDRFRSIWQM